MAQAIAKATSTMIRIAITGPESTGKSWLAENLADHYKSQWIPEYAREYLEILDHPYSYNDILAIAKGQFDLEENQTKNQHLLFCDTDMLVAYIWCKVKYGKCHKWIKAKLKENHYNLYLLCDVDLPWQFDKLREHPQMRSEIFEMYKYELQNRKFSYQIISGKGNVRLQNAIKAVDNFLLNLSKG